MEPAAEYGKYGDYNHTTYSGWEKRLKNIINPHYGRAEQEADKREKSASAAKRFCIKWERALDADDRQEL